MVDSEKCGSEHVEHRSTENLALEREQYSPSRTSRSRGSYSPEFGRNSFSRPWESQHRECSWDRQERSRDRQGKSPGEGNEAFEAFDLFRNYFDSRLSQLKNEISLHSLKSKDRKVTSIKEAHKIQYEFNLEILEDLEAILKELSKANLKGDVQSVISKIKHRNKLENSR